MLVVRHYQDADFDDLVRMFDETWGWELEGDEEENRALAVLYIALALLGSTEVFVAQYEGRVQGVACLQTSGKSVSSQETYDRAALSFLVQTMTARLKASESGRFALDFYEKIDAVNMRLLEVMRADNLLWDAELKLLLTSSTCRGLGVGKNLMKTVFDCLKAKKLAWCMLRTDTHCAWQYYEKTGWSRSAELVWEDGTDITAFAYRKRVE